MTGSSFLDFFKINVDRRRSLIEKHIAAHLQSKEGKDMMDLMRFHSNGNREEEDVAEQRSRAISFDALSGPGSSSGSSVGDTLTVDKIHHKMFFGGNEGSEVYLVLDLDGYLRALCSLA
jgi:hypothetical protein